MRSSLELSGDIGEFDKEDFMIGVIAEDVIIREPLLSPTKSVSVYAPTFYPMYFVQNLLAMDQKLAKEGYSTIEALYVFVEIATKAAERLGLKGSFSMSFGAGYGSARAGWIAEKGYLSPIFPFSAARICPSATSSTSTMLREPSIYPGNFFLQNQRINAVLDR